jgi:hypothetical protein
VATTAAARLLFDCAAAAASKKPAGRRAGALASSEANCLYSENSASAEFQPVASHEIVQPQQELRT